MLPFFLICLVFSHFVHKSEGDIEQNPIRGDTPQKLQMSWADQMTPNFVSYVSLRPNLDF